MDLLPTEPNRTECETIKNKLSLSCRKQECVFGLDGSAAAARNKLKPDLTRNKKTKKKKILLRNTRSIDLIGGDQQTETRDEEERMND